MYPIIDLTGKPAKLANEPEKDLCENYWVRLDKNTKVLFKYTEFKPYQHYAEKMSYEILKMLGIECARVELAKMGNKVGCISYNFLKRGEEIMCYGDIADLFDPRYNYREDYSIGYILESMRKFKSSQYNFDYGFIKVFEMIVSDYLTANTDRRDENFGAIKNKRTGKIERVTPLFDFGFTLGLRNHLQIIRQCLADEQKFQRQNADEKQIIDVSKRTKLSYTSYADFLTTSYFNETEGIIKEINNKITSKSIDEILNGFDSGFPIECREFAKRIVMERRNYLVYSYYKEKLMRQSGKEQNIEMNGFNQILEKVGEHARARDLAG